MTAVTVVSGLAGTGKTTYVRQHAQRGDLIVDMDYLFAAVSGLPLRDKPNCLLPFVCEARDAICQRLHRPSDVAHAWIITSNLIVAQHLAAEFNANHVQLECTEAERLDRLATRDVITEKCGAGW